MSFGVIFFPWFLFRFWILLADWGSGVLYQSSRGDFGIFFLVRLFHRLDFFFLRVYALCIISCSAAVIGSFLCFHVLLVPTFANWSTQLYHEHTLPLELFSASSFALYYYRTSTLSHSAREISRSRKPGKTGKLVV